MRNRIAASVVLGLLVIVLPAAAQAQASAGARCPSGVDRGDFASTSTLRKLNERLDSFGAPRATGNAAHRHFVGWLNHKLRRIDGVKVKSLSYPIRRWDERRTSLSLGDSKLPVAGPVPYSEPTPKRGVTAPMSFIPADEEITAANAAGKIVVRDLEPGSVPFAVFTPALLGIDAYDPTGLLSGGGDYERDFLAPVQPDLEAAGDAGAKGILFLRSLPRKQQKDFYAPYEGLQWKVPGAYVGSDQAERIRAALSEDPSADATLAIDAHRKPVRTRTLIATVRGKSRQRLVVDSHTDGTNAVEDNGPITMLAMARYLAGMPKACRAKTVQFAFVTGHFYQHLLGPGEIRDGGAEQVAAKLDRQYDGGTVGAVMVIEHLGAYQYDAVPRRDGGPGKELVRSDRHELALVPVTNSVPLREATVGMVKRYKLDPTAVIMGADVPSEDRVPHYCSFGGEGSPYERHLLPTVATIAAPNVLFDPAFGTEAIDFGYMHRQSLGYTDLLMEMSGMSRTELAGDVIGMRAERAAGTPTCPPN
jgi:hypothetical protein